MTSRGFLIRLGVRLRLDFANLAGHILPGFELDGRQKLLPGILFGHPTDARELSDPLLFQLRQIGLVFRDARLSLVQTAVTRIDLLDLVVQRLLATRHPLFQPLDFLAAAENVGFPFLDDFDLVLLRRQLDAFGLALGLGNDAVSVGACVLHLRLDFRLCFLRPSPRDQKTNRQARGHRQQQSNQGQNDQNA